MRCLAWPSAGKHHAAGTMPAREETVPCVVGGQHICGSVCGRLVYPARYLRSQNIMRMPGVVGEVSLPACKISIRSPLPTETRDARAGHAQLMHSVQMKILTSDAGRPYKVGREEEEFERDAHCGA